MVGSLLDAGGIGFPINRRNGTKRLQLSKKSTQEVYQPPITLHYVQFPVKLIERPNLNCAAAVEVHFGIAGEIVAKGFAQAIAPICGSRNDSSDYRERVLWLVCASCMRNSDRSTTKVSHRRGLLPGVRQLFFVNLWL